MLLRFRLPHGSGQRLEVLGLNRHEWGTVHFWLGAAFLAGIVLHLVLNWEWLVKIAAGRKRLPLVLGLGLGLLLVLLPLLAPKSELDRGGGQGRGRGWGRMEER